MITPRPYQRDALDALWNYYSSGKTGNALIAHPTGVGKSLLPALFISHILKNWPTQRFVLATHVSALVEQNANELLEHWPEAPLGIFSAQLKRKESAHSIVYGNVQSMVKKPELLGHRDQLWIDEAHLVGDKDNSQYLTFIAALKLINPNLRIVGMSATPFRQGMGMLTEGKIFTDIVHDLTKLNEFNKLIDDGYLCPLVPKRTQTELDVSGVSVQNGEFVGNQLQAAVNIDRVTYNALRETVEAGQDRRCWMIFSSGIEHAEHIATQLGAFGIDCAAIHSKKPNEYNVAALKAWKDGSLKSVVSYSKLTTGINNPYVDLICDLRPTMSIPLHCLDCHTEILTKDGFKSIESINKNDILSTIVLNQDSTIVHQYAPVDDIIIRNTIENERFVSYESFQLDWRVTENHKMIISHRFGRKKEVARPYLRNAVELIDYSDGVKIPISASGHNIDLPLTDANLRFIGLVMTDGSLAKDGSAIIYQSERYPNVLEEIRKCISESGMRFGEYIGKPRPPYFTMHTFQVAHGMPRKNDKHLTGWAHIEKYLNKDFALPLMDLSERQFDILIEAIHWGDGTKQSPKLSWTRRSYLITTGNKIFADRLQRTAIINGYKCNLKNAANNIILVTLKKKTWLNIQKSKDSRASIKIEKYSNEKVWCVSNKNGTIITRRNGKVTIMGNCQKLGRGTRIAPGKQNCLVLDFGRNIPRLGAINNPIIPRKKGEKPGDIPIKLCDNCGAYNHISARFCGGKPFPTSQGCGEAFTFEVKIVPKAGTSEIIKYDTPIIETFDVSGAYYEKREGRFGKPDYIKATYQCGLLRYSEVIFPESKGFALHKYHQWWLCRNPDPPPLTAEGVLAYIAQLRCPKRITVHVNLKPYPEIKSAEH